VTRLIQQALQLLLEAPIFDMCDSTLQHRKGLAYGLELECGEIFCTIGTIKSSMEPSKRDRPHTTYPVECWFLSDMSFAERGEIHFGAAPPNPRTYEMVKKKDWIYELVRDKRFNIYVIDPSAPDVPFPRKGKYIMLKEKIGTLMEQGSKGWLVNDQIYSGRWGEKTKIYEKRGSFEVENVMQFAVANDWIYALKKDGKINIYHTFEDKDEVKAEMIGILPATKVTAFEVFKGGKIIVTAGEDGIRKWKLQTTEGTQIRFDEERMRKLKQHFEKMKSVPMMEQESYG